MESTVEAVALDWLASLDWAVVHGPDLAPDTPAAERTDYGEVVLTTRLRSALARLNPGLPDDALEDAPRRPTRPAGATLEARNRDFHRMLVAGVTVEHVGAEGRVRVAQGRVLDYGEPAGNDWLAVSRAPQSEGTVGWNRPARVLDAHHHSPPDNRLVAGTEVAVRQGFEPWEEVYAPSTV